MVRLSDVPIWMVTEPAITEHLFRTPARREVEKLLRTRGHLENTKQGKGNHVKWTSPDGKVFIIPHCRELSIGVFNSLLKHLGCSKKEYLAMRSTL